MIHTNMPVSILTRSGSGDRTVRRYLYSTPAGCYEALTNPKRPIISKNDEILLVTLGDFSLYSKLASDEETDLQSIRCAISW